MTVPFWKAHGAGNDFLVTRLAEWGIDTERMDFPRIAKAICHRTMGVGGDGWYLMEEGVDGCDARIRLWNSDGSKAELSGNGTRCAAALLVHLGLANQQVRIMTGSGPRVLQFLGEALGAARFSMNMGVPRCTSEDLYRQIEASGRTVDATVLNVGNPQCSVPVDDIDFEWVKLGREIEGHGMFRPERTNVSFFQVLSPNRIAARFYERGAGATSSSGTGSVGAAVTAMLRGLTESVVTVETEAGPMEVAWEGSRKSGNLPIDKREESEARLTGPAVLVGRGAFFLADGSADQ